MPSPEQVVALFHHSRPWVYPMKIAGTFTRLHKASSALLFAFLAVVPWLRWGGEPVLLADVPSRRLYVLGSIFTAADGLLIMLLALAAAFSLFFFTTVFGRLWCGYFCPQSVFMINLVYPIEDLIEGPRGVRMRRDAGPPTLDRTLRKLAKWTVFAVFAWVASMSFMGFFVRSEVLWSFHAAPGAYAVVGFFTTIWFWDFAWYREQTCNLVCPYARFQSALTDEASLIISYDAPRGEPRGKAAKATGGCIDCNKCVTVCPQGIDIRNGFQLECIACGRCIDACESVMSKLGHPTLVRYSTLSRDLGQPRKGWHRTRTYAYGAILAAIFGGIGWNVVNHEPAELQVDRAPGSLWVEDPDGFVRNTFMVHVTDRNGADGTRTYAIDVDGLPEGAEVRATALQLASAERKVVPLIVRVPRAEADRELPLRVTVRSGDVAVEQKTNFKGPGAPSHEDERHERDHEHEDGE
jgi:cytochrome c oxidase accessory protein FixG